MMGDVSGPAICKQAAPSKPPAVQRESQNSAGLTSLIVVERPGTQPLPRQVRRLLVLNRVVIFGTVNLFLQEGERQKRSY